MSEEIVFYHNPLSRGRIAHWMLEEVGAPYRIEVLDLAKGEHKRPEYLALNPMGKVPIIVHRGVVVSETSAICAYLADAFPEAQLAPALDDPARGTYLRWLFFGAACAEPALVDKILARPAPESSGTLGYGSYEDMLNGLERAITPGPYILGERFSAADVYIGSLISWGLMTKSLEPRPTFLAYLARQRDRPAVRRSSDQTKRLAETLQASR
jgi:glutathione S-transferase